MQCRPANCETKSRRSRPIQTNLTDPSGPWKSAVRRPAWPREPVSGIESGCVSCAFRSTIRSGGWLGCTRSTLGCGLLDRLGHDANSVALVILARRGSHLVTLRRISGCLDCQSHVVNIFFAGLFTLRIRAFVRRILPPARGRRFGRRSRISLHERLSRWLVVDLNLLRHTRRRPAAPSR